MNNTQIFKNSFNLYNNELAKLNEKLGFISDSRKLNANEINLNNTEKFLVLKYLATKKDLTGVDVGDFENALDIIFEDKTELTKYIQELYVQTKQPLIKLHLKSLLEAVFNKAMQDSHVDMTTSAYKKMAKSWMFPFKGSHSTAILYLNKLYTNREFIFKKSLNSNYLPTVEAETNDPYGFNDLSLEDLQAAFAPSNFYNLMPEHIEHLCQAFVNKYLEANNVPTCKLNFKNMSSSNKTIIHGEYLPNAGMIDINQRYIDGFKTAKNNLNCVFPLKLMSTLVHEARHRVQFANLNSNSLNAKDELVKQSILHPNCTEYLEGKSNSLFIQYLSLADEIDARNAALEAIAYMATQNQSITNMDDMSKIATFYNQMIEQEQNNQKLNIKDDYKILFDYVYSDKKFTIKNEKSLKKEIAACNDQVLSLLKANICSDWINTYNEPVMD